MLSYEEAGLVLDELVDELPEGIFENLNGGVSFVEETVTAEDGRYTLGTYFRNGMGRYIELYYGSFVELYGEMDDELFRRRLKSTLHHELTHHIESMATEALSIGMTGSLSCTVLTGSMSAVYSLSAMIIRCRWPPKRCSMQISRDTAPL